MLKLESVKSLKDQLAVWKAENQVIGFVPTMGALHEGHLSLVRKAKNECDKVIVSIFVNPTQFDNATDLSAYPKTFARDFQLLDQELTDAVFLPTYDTLYPDNYEIQVQETRLSAELCGAHRPGHFAGMLTVVLKLLNLVGPNRAYFGEKDYQQLQLIKKMVTALFVPVEIVGCPLVREADGLAMSSRNLRLSPAARKTAPLLFQELRKNAALDEIRASLENKGFQVEYLEEKWGRRFVAAHLESVRLIDNVQI